MGVADRAVVAAAGLDLEVDRVDPEALAVLKARRADAGVVGAAVDLPGAVAARRAGPVPLFRK